MAPSDRSRSDAPPRDTNASAVDPPTLRSLEDSLPHRRWGRPIGVPGWRAVTRSPSLVIAVASALAVCVAGTAAAVGASPTSATGGPVAGQDAARPHRPVPHRRAWPPSSTSTTVPVTLAGSTIPPGTVQLTDATRRIRVNVPNTWTDTLTSPSISDDGGARPTAVGVGRRHRRSATAGRYRACGWSPSTRASTPTRCSATTNTAARAATAAWSRSPTPTSPACSSDGRTAVAGRPRLLVVSGRPPDGSATVLLQLQTLSPDDPAVNLVLDSFSLVPGSKPPAAVEASQPATVGDVPPSLLHTTAPPDAQRVEDSGHHLAVTVPADWTAKDVEARTNDDYSNRPFLLVGPDLDAYQHFVGAGLVMQQLPYRDPSIPLTLFGHDGTCTDAGVQTFPHGATHRLRPDLDRLRRHEHAGDRRRRLARRPLEHGRARGPPPRRRQHTARTRPQHARARVAGVDRLALDLGGTWRAREADDDAAPRRHRPPSSTTRLGRRRRARALAIAAGILGERRPAPLPHAASTLARPAPGDAPLDHVRRDLLPGRRLARRRLPRRPRGLLLPAQLRRHRRSARLGDEHLLAVEVDLRPRAGHDRPAQHHRAVPALRGGRPGLEPGRPLARRSASTTPVRCASTGSACCAATPTRRAPTCACTPASTATTPATVRAAHLRRRARSSARPSTPSPPAANEIEWTLDVDQPRAVVAARARRPAADRRSTSTCSSTTR